MAGDDQHPVGGGVGWTRSWLPGAAGRILALAVTLLVVASLLGVSPTVGDRALQVAVVWSGHELEQFREVVAEFEASPEGRPVNVISTGDDIDGFLRARARAGNLPDVAILPAPSFIETYVENGWLQPLDAGIEDEADAIGPRYLRFWQDLGEVETEDGSSELYGAWVKASFKSWIWYHTSYLSEADEPETWSDLVALVEEWADEPGPAPLAVGAANGWVLTDWFENLLLATRGSGGRIVYDELLAGRPCWGTDEVRETLDRLAELWSIDGALPGGGPRARLTQFDEAVVQVAAAGQGRMLQGSDFVQAITGGVLEPRVAAEDLRSFRFPSDYSTDPVLVGGDVAVVFEESEEGRHLVEWLTRPDSFRSWTAEGGYLSPLATVDGEYPDDSAAEVAAIVRDPSAHNGRFDLSNQVGEPIEPTLQEFFAEVAVQDAAPGEAVDRVVEELNRAAGSGECPLVAEP